MPLENARLRIEGVSKSYGAATALAPTDLLVKQGEFLSLLGPSGSGKTTLLNIVAGTVAPTSGRILLDDRDITRLPSRKRNLGMVFQHYALVPHMSVFDNVAFPLKVRGVSRNEIVTRVRTALATVRLDHLADRKPQELSGGQQQRVSIARCLIYDPPVILMDEPLGALDKSLREAMQFEIKRLHTQLGMTAIYVTHDQDEAMALSDRICVMNNGSIEQLSVARDLYYRPVNRFVAEFLGESNLLPGKIVASGASACLQLPDGTSVLCTPGCSLSAGDAAFAMIRPESITISRSGDDSATVNRLAGQVEGIDFVGGVSRIRLVCGNDLRVSAKLLSSHETLSSLSAGDTVWATWKFEDTILFPTPSDAVPA